MKTTYAYTTINKHNLRNTKIQPNARDTVGHNVVPSRNSASTKEDDTLNGSNGCKDPIENETNKTFSYLQFLIRERK